MQAEWQDAKDLLDADTVEFSINTERGRPVTGAVWLTDSASAPDFLMCFGHGASDDRYQDPICTLASKFRDIGIPSLSIDGPVHGLRRIEPGGREALAVEMQRPEAFADMQADWTVGLNVAKSLPGLSDVQIGFFGLSMGSIFGIPFAASRDDMIAATFGLLGIRDNSFGQLIGEAASQIDLPLRFIVQLEDELFDRESCLALFDAFSSEEKSLGANPGLHPDVPAEEYELAFDFLVRQFDSFRSANSS